MDQIGFRASPVRASVSYGRQLIASHLPAIMLSELQSIILTQAEILAFLDKLKSVVTLDLAHGHYLIWNWTSIRILPPYPAPDQPLPDIDYRFASQ